jgi:hypothetical protein
MIEEQDQEPGRKLLYERKRTRPAKVLPHELKPMNRLVAGGIIVGTLAAIAAGWYVMHPSEGSKAADPPAKDAQKAE